MASAFMGLYVFVKLKDPPLSLNGLVASVNGKRLSLIDGKQLKEYIVRGAEIADIEVLAPPSPPTPFGKQAAPTNFSRTQEGEHYPLELPGNSFNSLKSANKAIINRNPRTTLLPQTQQPFTDPAILSFERSVSSSNALPTISNQTLPAAPASGRDAAENDYDGWQTKSGSKAVFNSSIQCTSPRIRSSDMFRNTLVNLSTSYNIFNLQNSQEVTDAPTNRVPETERIQDADKVQANETNLGLGGTRRIPVKIQKRGKPKNKQEKVSVNDVDTSPENQQKPPDILLRPCRQTPMLQQHIQETSNLLSRNFQSNLGSHSELLPRIDSTQRGRKQKVPERKSTNGWATEDASDVLGMGDFDFEANLSKFDKLALWDELRNGEKNANEDWLVSLNRVKRPMHDIFGGKKLLPSENVLDLPIRKSRDDGFEDSSNELHPSSSHRIRRNHSRSSLMEPDSRKDGTSAVPEVTASGLSGQRSFTTCSLSQAKQSDSQSGRNSKAPRASSSTSSSSFSPSVSDIRYEPSLRYATSNKICRTMSPETLMAVETLAHNGFGMSEDILAENAGRGIAEIVLWTIDPKGYRLTQPNHNALPVVVVLVGDNKAGGRALAAARHLMERNVRVVASFTGSLDLKRGPLSSQIHRFRDKILRTWVETSTYLNTLNAPPELIVDGLVGVQSKLEDLEREQLATAIDMMAWANKSKASVLAIDIPSGIDSSRGTFAMRDGEPTMVRSKIVVSCGAPCTGLLEAMKDRQNEQAWRIFVADTGLNPAARLFLKVNAAKKDSYHRGKYICFGSDWVVGLRYDPGNIN